MSTPEKIKTYSSDDETQTRIKQFIHFKDCPIRENQLMSNLGMFLNSKTLARILFMEHLYKQIIDVQGVVMEFGTRWGQNLSLFAALRGIYEPFNRHRKLIGFDTFTGFPTKKKKDGNSDMIQLGELATTEFYYDYLYKQICLQEQDNPLSHICKFELCKGDATVEIGHYLVRNPHTIIALAYFDFDLYEPTKICLEKIKNRLTKGSVVGFDELNDPDSPGETLALIEVFGLNNIELKRLPITSRTSYFVVN
jgi:hypothetical protein